MGVAVKTEKLTKEYSGLLAGVRVNAVDNLDLEVQEGEIFGFLGPNGAGKTTTIKMLLGIIYPTSGQAWVLDREIGHIETHRVISYLPENPYFYDHMTGKEILSFYARLFGIREPARSKRVDELLEQVGLGREAHKSLRNYSKGMLQRIGLAQSLINDPKLLFMDEPTAGLDPIAHVDIRRLIIDLRSQGKTVFISSHQLEDVEEVCDRVAILNRGKMVATGKMDDLLAGGRVDLVADSVENGVMDKVKKLGGVVSLVDGRLVVEQPDNGSIDQVIDIVRAEKGHILSVNRQRKTLEDFFVETIQQEGKN